MNNYCFYCPTMLRNISLTLDYDNIFCSICSTCATEYYSQDDSLIKVILKYPDEKMNIRIIYFPISGVTLLQKTSSGYDHVYDHKWQNISVLPNHFLINKKIPEIHKKINMCLIFN